MSRLIVQRQSHDDLSSNEKAGASNNGGGAEWANYIRITHCGQTLFLESDAMEPEDATFTRDLAWVEKALKQVYQLGMIDGAADARAATETSASRAFPFMACPNVGHQLDELEGCANCKGVGYHNSVPNPEWNAASDSSGVVHEKNGEQS